MSGIPSQKLDRLIERWTPVQTDLAAGAAQEDFVRLSREFAELDPVVSAIRALMEAQAERTDLNEILGDPESDEALKELALSDLEPLQPKITDLEQDIRVLLLPN